MANGQGFRKYVVNIIIHLKPKIKMGKSKKRCDWCKGDNMYVKYHDKEWGVPVFNDKKLFECMILETFQAGLSWLTILKKRSHFKKAFDNFDYKKIAKYSDEKLDSLITNKNIIRNKSKIYSTKKNAICFMQTQKEFGSFKEYLWRFVNFKPIDNEIYQISELPSQNALSHKISKDLKKRGFKFIGPTVTYAYMQAVGMINDHLISCFKYQDIKNLYPS